MVLLAQDFSPQAASAKVGLRLEPSRLPHTPGIGIGLAIDDLSLSRQLRRTILTQPGLSETADAIADVVITDRDAITGRNVLRLNADLAETADVDLIVAAARLRAAGYRIERGPLPAAAPAPTRRALSAREQQVAELLVDGASNKVVARALDISVHTAKFHVTAILEKLGARNRADAVAIILREGLVPS
jgi:DNA-binding NarL/FixJ family response regulator